MERLGFGRFKLYAIHLRNHRFNKKYVIPIVEIFNSKSQSIEFLKLNGTQFNSWTEKSLHPLDYMLCFADKMDAEQFFNNFIGSCSYKNRITLLYKELELTSNIDLNYSEFHYANKVKLAFVNGLNITN